MRILLVDDHIIFRDGLKALINTMDGYEVVEEASNGIEALDKLKNTVVDIVLCDIHMPEMDGLTLISELRKNFPELKVVALTMDSDRYYVDKILDLGADGYVTKATNSASLKNVLQNIMDGQNQFMLVMSEHELKNARTNESGKLAELTKRELEVLALISEGWTDKEIASKIFLSAHTITTHRKNLLSKLGLNNKVELAKFALQNKVGNL